MNISVLGDERPIVYAAEELEKYLTKISVDAEIKLGLFSDFDGVEKEESTDTDSFIIDIENGKGIIAGSNPRSVLYGAYTYLKKFGIRWVRPGIDGEYIPEKINDVKDVKVEETASYTYRGLCGAGALKIENLLEEVEWAARMGYNRLFIELVDASVIFERWYNKPSNPNRKVTPITKEQIAEFFDMVGDEVLKRGMIYQRAGHGFMCEPFGINVKDWGAEVEKGFELSDEMKEVLPLINGKRQLQNNTPMITNFCFSNKKARDKVVAYTTEYAKAHPEVEELQFWLADGYNNHCECEECSKKLPTDFYVMMLNELDEAFTKKGVKSKIVLLSYVELLWPPISEKLKNPDRFIMMFCPITRSNSISYKAEDPAGRDMFLPEFKRNDIDWPMSAAENLAFLREWQKTQPAIRGYFEFGYHFYWRLHTDFSFYNSAKILCEDVSYLEKAGLDGMITCQGTRAYSPTGLGLYSYAETLWNKDRNFDEIANEYLEASFGDKWEFVKKYLQTLSEVSEYSQNRYYPDVPGVYVKKRCQWTREFIENTLKDRTVKAAHPVWEASWKYLNYYAEFLTRFTYVLEALDAGNLEDAKKYNDDMATYLYSIEDEVQPVFDVDSVINRYKFVISRLEQEK